MTSTSSSSHKKIISSSKNPSFPPVSHFLGNWQLLEQIDRGTTADIFLAIPRDARPNSSSYYVLKVLREEWQEQPLVLNQFRRESALCRRISHPHIVGAVSARLEEAPYFFVMPFQSGHTLAQHFEQQTRLALPIILGIVRQAAHGVAELHRLKLLHNDLKPANLFINDDGHTMLLDLGSVREMAETGNVFQRPILGSMAYMAPEQFVSSYHIEQASDLYSLGVILYQAISKALPIEANTLEEFITKVRTVQPIPLRQHCPTVSVELAELVHSLLAKSPTRRLDNADTLAQELAKHEIASLNQFWPDDFLEMVFEELESV